MRTLYTALILVVGSLVAVSALQTGLEAEDLLPQLFPDAASFSPKESNPPHYKAFDASGQVIGFAYWTTELEPLERGFDGPIKIFVGMDTNLILRGIVVTENREPYGDFSVDLPGFAAQFEHKNVRDPFRVGSDIDAVSRATISVTSASRAVRNSSRRVARALLAPPSS